MISALVLLLELSQASGPANAFSTAQEQMRQGNCAGVIDALKPVLESDVASGSKIGTEAYQWLSICYERTGDGAHATETLRQGLRSNADSPALKRALGELLFHLNANDSEAGELLASAVKQAPRDPEARHYYAQWAFLNSREQICADQEQSALHLPGLSDVALLQIYTLQGLCLSHLEQPAAAKSAFSKAFEKDLNQNSFDPVMAYQYVQFLSGRGDNDEAKHVIEETLIRCPRFGPAHLERAKAFDHERQTERAIDEAKAALSGEGNDDDNVRAAHVILAKSYFILGKTPEAEAEQKWIESHGKNSKE